MFVNPPNRASVPHSLARSIGHQLGRASVGSIGRTSGEQWRAAGVTRPHERSTGGHVEHQSCLAAAQRPATGGRYRNRTMTIRIRSVKRKSKPAKTAAGSGAADASRRRRTPKS